MAGPIVLIFHRPAAPSEPPLVRLLAGVRERLADHQAALFRRAGAGQVRIIEGGKAASFGETLAGLAPQTGGLVVLGSGGVPRLNSRDAAKLISVASLTERRALTNNRYSSDICAVGYASVLRELPPLPNDNALPRWLEERAGFAVSDMPGRDRLALDLDTPLDIALAVLAPGSPRWVAAVAAAEALSVPRQGDIRQLAADPLRELLVFGRSGSSTMAWLERNVRCRVRFLSEERGLRASTPLAISAEPVVAARPPRASLGRLLETAGPGSLADVVADLADGAIIDTRVLFAHRLGVNEADWPSAADRFASDLHRADEVGDPWLRELTASAADSPLPILLGAHTLVGPGVRILLSGVRPVEHASGR
jgi:CTP:molybdopterin cytidylyltransferase MocA